MVVLSFLKLNAPWGPQERTSRRRSRSHSRTRLSGPPQRVSPTPASSSSVLLSLKPKSGSFWCLKPTSGAPLCLTPKSRPALELKPGNASRSDPPNQLTQRLTHCMSTTKQIDCGDCAVEIGACKKHA